MQTHSPDRRRAAFRPQAGKSLAGQVIQDPLDHAQRHSGFASFRWRGKPQSLHCLRWWVFDTRDDRDRSSALRTDLHIYLKNPLEAQRSGCRQGRFAFCARSPWLKPRPRVPIASPSVAQPVCGLRFGRTLWASYPKPRRAGVIRARWGLLGANTRATASLPYCLRSAQDVRSLSPALWKRVRFRRGGGTSAASRAIKSSGSKSVRKVNPKRENQDRLVVRRSASSMRISELNTEPVPAPVNACPGFRA